MYYITINAKQITRYYINVVTRETKFHNNFHHFSMKCSNNIYASLYIIHTSVVLTLCFTLLAILFNFLRGFFSFSILATLWDFFLKRNIRGFKISEFEVASLLTDIRNFTFQNLPKTITTHYIELSPAHVSFAFFRIFLSFQYLPRRMHEFADKYSPRITQSRSWLASWSPCAKRVHPINALAGTLIRA